MIKIGENIFVRFTWLVMALLIFNYSIDVPDAFGDEVAEDLSFNDIESIAELVLENVLGVYDAIPEHDENDLEDEGGFCKKVDYKFNQTINYQIFTLQKTIDEEKFCLQHPSSKPQSAYSKGLIKPPQA
jgi:hypothetical protein